MDPARPSDPASPAETASSAVVPRLLIVDDQVTSRTIVTTICQKLGFLDIDCASNGEEALALLADRTYGLVISDWNMAPVTGFELLRRVRADARLAPTKFLIMTARTDADAFVAAKRAGVDNILIKPFTLKTLQEKVLAVLE